jgi:hypothetical protein
MIATTAWPIPILLSDTTRDVIREIIAKVHTQRGFAAARPREAQPHLSEAQALAKVYGAAKRKALRAKFRARFYSIT